MTKPKKRPRKTKKAVTVTTPPMPVYGLVRLRISVYKTDSRLLVLQDVFLPCPDVRDVHAEDLIITVRPMEPVVLP